MSLKDWFRTDRTLENPVFVWVSDIHINSKQALSMPDVYLGDGDHYRANMAQRALYEAWPDAWNKVKKKANGRPIVTCFGGEIVDIDWKNRSNQYITKDVEKVREHAFELIAPVIDLSSKIIVLRGTEAHVGNNGAQDEAMAAMIEKSKPGVLKRNEVTDENSWHYFRGFIGGRYFDLAHHVNMGGMPRTEKNAANHLAADLIMQYARWEEPLPDFAFRGHVHRVADSSMNYNKPRAIIAPCWQLPTPYIHRIGQGASKPDIGLLFCDIAKKEVDYIAYEYRRESPEHI